MPRRALNAPFFGRQAELADIERLLAYTPVVTLVGAAGCGKTRLADEAVAAAWATDRFPDGAAWADLAALPDGAGVVEVTAALGAAAGVASRPGAPVLDQLRTRLGSGRLVAVLDNCEHVIDGVAELLDALAVDGDGVRVIATSQEAVRVAGEAVVAIGPLPLDAALALFMSRVALAAPSFVFTDDDGAAAAEVCRRLDGVPLALELAAAATPALGVVELAAHLDERFGLLVSGRRTDMLRHQTLEAAIRWSLDRLPPDLVPTLGALSVFAGGFTLDAARAVAGASASDVAALVAKSLVEREATGRYLVLESIRLLARDGVAAGDLDATAKAHLEWCRDLAGAAGPDLAGPNEGDALARLQTEWGNLRAALTWSLAAAHDAPAGAALALSLARFWHLRGYVDEAAAWIDQALVAGPEILGPLLTAMGTVRQAQGRLVEAHEHFEEAVAWAGAHDDEQVRARGLQGVGHVAAVRGDYEAASAALAHALGAARRIGDTEAVVGVLHSQASVSTMRGDYATVRELAEEGRAVAAGAGYGRGEAFALLQLAGAELAAGLNPDAARHLIRSLELGRELDIPLVLSTALGTLGSLAFNTGDFAEASSNYHESLSVARAIGDRRLEMITLYNLSEVARVRADIAESRRWLVDASTIARQLGDRRAMAMIHTSLADIARDIGDLDGSAGLLAQALTVRRDIGDRRGVASTLDSIARLVDRRGDRDDAVRLAAAATAMYEAIGAARPAEAAASIEELVALTDDDVVATLLADGRAWSVEAAVERALALVVARPLELPEVEVEVADAAPPSTEAAVAVEVLGGFVVRRHGEPVPARAWQSKKARELLKLLIVRRGQPVPREQLVESLWPGDDPSATANRLRVALSVLRAVLDPEKASATDHYVRSEDASLRLDLDHVDVDVERFLNALVAGDQAVAEALYRGEVLPEDVYADWSVPLREEARVAYVSVATALLRTAVARGDDAVAARLSVRLLERDPYDEASHLALVRALSRLGRHGDARRSYAAYVERMEEIGVAVEALRAIVGAEADRQAVVEEGG